MSDDVEVATHDQPSATGAPDGVTVDGPFAAEADELAESLAAAVLAPRRLVTVSDPSRGRHAHPPEQQAPGHLSLDMDWRVLYVDPRWCEAIAGLFASVANAVNALPRALVRPG